MDSNDASLDAVIGSTVSQQVIAAPLAFLLTHKVPRTVYSAGCSAGDDAMNDGLYLSNSVVECLSEQLPSSAPPSYGGSLREMDLLIRLEYRRSLGSSRLYSSRFF